MSLWAEHLGVLEDCFCQPETLECMRKVNSIAKTNWQIYAAEEHKEMTGHLMQYPIQVNKDGKVTTLPGQECICLVMVYHESPDEEQKWRAY